MKTSPANPTRILLTGLSLLALSACHVNNNGGGGGNGAETVTPQKAVVATAAADFSSGAHAVFSTEAPFDGVTQQSPSGNSDLTVDCHGEYFYRIERFTGENVTRFHISEPGTALSQFSTQDSSGVETGSSNPYQLVFVSDTKAYLLRYGSPKVWIVNPSAQTSETFKTGEIDLSAYNIDDAPQTAAGVIVDGKLFIAMQRLKTSDFSFAPQQAYVAVIDTATDSEIDTQPGQEGLKGIALPVKNPGDIEYDPDSGLIYVQGTGRYGAFDGSRDPEYSGGIAAIDPTRYTTQMVLDDGDSANHPLGQITRMEILSATKGYVVGYRGFSDNALYSFNPSTRQLDVDADGNPVVVAGISGHGIGGLAHNDLGQLWVSIDDNADPHLTVLNGSDGSVIEAHIATTLNPQAIAFCHAP